MDHSALDTTDENLWLAFREGSENAFDVIYGKMFPVLFNYGYRLCQDEELVKDCIQNIFVEIWHKRGQIKQVYSLKHYFLKILRRKIFKALKSSNCYDFTLNTSRLMDENEHQYISLFQEEAIESGEVSPLMKKRIQHAISHLSHRKKEVILLKFYENLTNAEISEVMELKDAKYARQLIYRTLDELRKQLVYSHDVSFPSYPVYALCFLLLFA